MDAVRLHFGEMQDGLFTLNLAASYINQYLAERRALFTTDRGHIGTGAPGVRVGDRLALIAGVRVPMVLREKRGGVESMSSSGRRLCLGLWRVVMLGW